MANNDLPSMPCPVCADCDHDVRTGILTFLSDVQANITEAGEKLLDALEAPSLDVIAMAEAMRKTIVVRRQMSVLLEVMPELAAIKELSQS